MKLSRKITVGLAVVTLIGVLCAFLLRSDNREQQALEETRRDLRQQGFKVDLTEFDFSTSDELRAREAALTNAVLVNAPRNRDDYARRSALAQNNMPDLMAAVGSNAALVAWKQDKLPGRSGEDLWPMLRESLNPDRDVLDAACQAALAGPIRFNLIASHGTGMLLPHLAALKRLAQTLGTRTVLELRDGNKDAAWTNLLALTRLVTAWEPEPAEISHLVRFNCATIAYNAIWQVLQAEGWTDNQLAQVQKEWESVDFFRGLPETAAFTRAGIVAGCRLERQQPLSGPRLTLRGTFQSPRYAWSALNDYWQRLRYRRHGTYADERNLLLYYRDRELELRRAVQSPTWSEMRSLPGVTNMVPFQSKYHSGNVTMMNTRQLGLAWSMYADGQGRSYGLLGRGVEAETRRRLLITAIALERYQGRYGSYPKTLGELTPELLKGLPVDFMDGQPLRYHRKYDGRFVLYSVGLDCLDNGGQILKPRTVLSSSAVRRGFGADLVWPRPASSAEIELARQEELKLQAQIADHNEDLQAEEQWQDSARRQAKVERLLAAKPTARSAEPTFRGRPLSGVLLNKNSTTTNQITLDELLTLKSVTTGEEPETVTFETPINYDVLTNLGALYLLVDPERDEDSDEGYVAGQFDCQRAANGNCRLVWSTIYESPGKHALQVGLELNEPDEDDQSIVGPITPFVVSNLCQFSLSSAYFNPDFGATLRAKLPELNGTYSIEITSPVGELLKTIAGATSNGIMKVHWDLTDERGRRCTNNAYGTLIRVTLPDSGRSQTLKGP